MLSAIRSGGILRRFLSSRLSSPLFSYPSRAFSRLARISSGNGLGGLRSLLFSEHGGRSEQQQQAVTAGVTGAVVRQVEQVRGMKTRSSVKRLCDGCKILYSGEVERDPYSGIRSLIVHRPYSPSGERTVYILSVRKTRNISNVKENKSIQSATPVLPILLLLSILQSLRIFTASDGMIAIRDRICLSMMSSHGFRLRSDGREKNWLFEFY